MVIRKTAAKTAAKSAENITTKPIEKTYVILDSGFDQCYCSDTYDNINNAIKDATKHYENGGHDSIYVVEIVKTVSKGKPTVYEGYHDEETD